MDLEKVKEELKGHVANAKEELSQLIKNNVGTMANEQIEEKRKLLEEKIAEYEGKLKGLVDTDSLKEGAEKLLDSVESKLKNLF